MSHIESRSSFQPNPTNNSCARRLSAKFFTVFSLLTILAVSSLAAPAQTKAAVYSSSANTGSALMLRQPVIATSIFDWFDFLGFNTKPFDNEQQDEKVSSRGGGMRSVESKPLPFGAEGKENSFDAPSAAPCGAAGVTRTVGPTGQFSTIQAAINASSPIKRDTIMIAPGMYPEQLIINKCVNIVGSGQTGMNATIVQAPATLALSQVPLVNAASIVEVRSSATVTISGLTISGPPPFPAGSDPNNPPGVYGVFVIENSALIMRDVTVTSIRRNPLDGSQNGFGIRAGSVSFNQIGSLDLTRVTVSDYQKGGIIVSNDGSTASVKDSLIQGIGANSPIGQNGIEIADGATATLTNNTITGNVCDAAVCGPNPVTQTQSAGILLAASGLTTVSGNTISNNDSGYLIFEGNPSIQQQVTGNTFSNNRYFAFYLDQSNTFIQNNFISGGNQGAVVLSYGGNASNTIINFQGNSITGASQAGIRLIDVSQTDLVFPVVTANFNRISNSSATGTPVIGIDAAPSINSPQVNAENNFWGCNQGPNGGAGCDTTTGNVDGNPYLRLTRTSAATSPVGVGGTSVVTTNLRFNSDNVDTFTATNHLPNPIASTPTSANSPNGIPVNFSATNGTVNPAVTPLVNGLAQTTFTGGTVNGGDQSAVITARVDNATDTATVTVLDTVAPTVLSATAVQTTPTTVTYTVTFSEAVTGVNITTPSDFTLTTVTGNVVASITGISGTGSTRTVTITIASGMGTIRLDVVDDNTIVDTAGTPNPLNGAASNPTFPGQVFTVDVQMPTVTINQAAGQPDPTSSSPINFTVVFSEPVTGFATGDVSFAGSTAGGTLVGTVTQIAPNDSTTYNVAVTGMTSGGTVVASIPANVAVDSTNNGNAASTPIDNSVTFLLARVTRLRDNAIFTTIQSGIDDSGTVNGDTLLASPGVYNERIVVTKELTIRGAQFGVLAKPRANINAESTIVVDNSATLPVDIQVDRVTIDGFNFDINQTFPTTTTIDKPSYIILAGNTGGAAADGYQNLRVINNRLAATANYATGTADRRAIGAATAVDMIIEGNYVANYPSQSVTISDGSTNLIYRNNDSFNAAGSSITLQANFRNAPPQRRHVNYLIENNRFDQDGILLFLSQGGTIRNNTFTQAPSEAGILMLGGNDAVNVSNNTFTLSNAQAMVSSDGFFGFGQDSNINFISNTVTRPSDATTTGSFSAIDYRGTGGTNTIANNTLQITGTLPAGNSTYAMRIRGSASGNFNITGNFFNGNGVTSTGTAVSTAGLYISSNTPGTPTTPGNGGPGNFGQIPASSVLNINCNTFRQFQNGIIVFNNVANTTGGLANGGNIHINGNNLIANTNFGINNGGTSATIDGTNNYWNSPTGPSGAGPGTGDAVSANVTYTPFLTVPSMCAPINTVPGTQTINQDTTLTFTGANQISIADADVLNNPVTVTLSVTNGTLSLSQTTGLTFTAGDGTADATMTFSGTLANVNAALAGLTFSPTAGFVGTSTLTITSSSMGSPGVGGGTQSDTDTVTINVLDAIAPTVTINQATTGGQTDPTSTSPINFTVVFSEPVANFATGDVTVTGSAFGPGSTPVATVTGSGTTYNVAVSGMTRSGTVRVTIAAGVASDAQGNLNTPSTSNDNTVTFNFVVVNPVIATRPVHPLNISMERFAFINESVNGAIASGGFVTGPLTPPLGIGSAQLTVDGEGRIAIATDRYAATRLADISSLKYSAISNKTDGTTITLSFDVDYDLSNPNSADTTYQNRLVYVPNNPAGTPAWREFDTLAGTFYSSGAAGNPGFDAGCRLATPCTKQQLLNLFPNVGILGGQGAIFQGGLYLRAGGPITGGMVANADKLVVGVNGNQTTFDFEPSPPTISIGNATVTEGNSGTVNATFALSLSVASTLDTTVNVSTADGTATLADNDYVQLANQLVTIPAGQQTANVTVTVPVKGDTKVEADETFTVNLSNALNAAIVGGVGIGKIINDDVTVGFSPATYSVNEGDGTATISVCRSGITPATVTVNYATSNGTATAGADYTATSGTLTFLPNDTCKSFTIPITDDLFSEGPAAETINLTLSMATGGATIAVGTAVLSITDNDGGGFVTIAGNIKDFNPAGNTNLQGVTVTLTLNNSVIATTTTDVNGNYSFGAPNNVLPAGGNYQVTPTPGTPTAGKIFDPNYRTYTNLNVNVSNANFVAYNNLNDVPRKVRFGLTTVAPGSQVTVPVRLNSLGNENSVSFSFTYDKTRLGTPVVTLGADAVAAGATFGSGSPSINTTTGTIAVLVVAPAGATFGAAGTKEIVRVQFNTVTGTTPNAALNFTNSPTQLQVRDANQNILLAQFINGFVVFAQGIEGDVQADTPPNAGTFQGDGDVDSGDLNLIGNWIVGNGAPDFASSNQFQRADCEPLGVAGGPGDADVDSGDFGQAVKFLFGIDPLQPAGGPAYPNPLPPGFKSILNAAKSSAIPRVVGITSASGLRGNTVTVTVQINAEAGDTALQFSLDYDANRLTTSNAQVNITPQAAAAGASLFKNASNPGKVTVFVQNTNGGFAAGNNSLATIQFTIKSDAPLGVSQLTFNDAPTPRQVRDANNVLAQTNYNNGTVTVNATPTASSAEVSGRVRIASGKGIGAATVTLTDEQGNARSVQTDVRGRYRITEVQAGRTYTIVVSTELYSFAPQVITVQEDLTNFDLIVQ